VLAFTSLTALRSFFAMEDRQRHQLLDKQLFTVHIVADVQPQAVKTLDLLFFLVGFGWISSCLYLVSGAVLCMTLVGFQFGMQCFSLARTTLFPFEPRYYRREYTVPAVLLNLLWSPVGIALAAAHVSLAAVNVATIIGIPFAGIHLQLARRAFFPFGVRVSRTPLDQPLQQQYGSQQQQQQ
jgi:uncharacterized membrane protein YccF (DUF307 family)